MPRGYAHGTSFRKFGGPEKRLNLLRTLVNVLIKHERIETTFAKAHEAQKYTNRLIEIAKRGTDDAYSRDMIKFWAPREEIQSKLLNDLVPRFKEHKSDFTRLAVLSKQYCAEPRQSFHRYAVLELKGNPLPPLPIQEKNPHTLQNVLIAAAQEEMFNKKES
uniref:Large ribosomal subunit protein bL17m n=1 Tax=Phallusia mammillata TaxID=59560 RepID=A0A6F9DL97_9ASCI|nr:39S ribosomal protein L17, mitochondrial-like [Phallusia mammillata]